MKSIISKQQNIIILIFLCVLSLGIFALAQTLIYKSIGLMLDEIVYVNIPSSVFTFFIGSFFCLGILIGGVGVSLMRAWNYMELIDRIENPIFADQVKFWIDVKIKQNGWDEIIEKERKK